MDRKLKTTLLELLENKDFEPYIIEKFGSYKVTLTPDTSGGDGFFIARFRRKI